MSSVDDRIVNMQFNNKQFTQGVQQTNRDLTGLEKTMTTAGKSKGLTTMASAAQTVSTRFGAMQIAGTAALATIASKATIAGLNLVKSLTIAPIMDGFKEYTTNLESVQTIMANTGKDVKTVNRYLDELNAYSDQTIYNFSEMAKNIGTFTAAGVELKTATSAIKGIANLAALSGSNSQKASTAMYQLSQAIAAGRVSLQDWNSVVNAGMAGKQFKTALARTAVAMGDLSADAVKVGTDVEIMGQSFRNSISAASGQESWLSSDILVRTLSTLDGRFSKTKLAIEGYSTKQQINNQLTKERNALAKEGIVYSEEEYQNMLKMADAAFSAATTIKTFPQLMGVIRESFGSMWAGAFEIILGDFEQSKKLWTSVGEVITGPSGIISQMSSSFLGTLRMWEDAGGRTKIIKGLSNVFGGLGAVLGKVKKAFQDVFPPGASNFLLSLSQAFKDFSENLVPSYHTLRLLRSIFGGVFAVMHIGVTIIKGLVSAFTSFFSALFDGSSEARGGILSILASIGEVLIAFDAWLTQGGRLTDFMSKFGTVVGAALAPIVGIIGLVIQAFAALASGQGVGAVMRIVYEIQNVFLGMFESILGGLARITAPFEKLSNFFTVLQDKVVGMKVSFADLTSPLDSAGGGAGEAITNALNKVADAGENVGNKLSESFEKVSDATTSVKTGADDMYGALTGAGASAATSSTSAVSSGAEKVGAVFQKIGDILRAVGGGIADAFGWMVEMISKIPFPDDALEWAAVLNALISGALIKRLLFSDGVFDSLAKAIEGMGDSISSSFDQLTSTLKTMQTAIKAETIKNIAIAVALLVASLVALSFIPMDKLKVGLGALAGTFAILAVMLVAISKIDAGMKISVVAAGLVLIAGAILILTAAIAALGFLPLDVLKQGIAGMAAALAVLVVSLLMMSGLGPKVAAAGGAMILMATAINLLVGAIVVLGLLPLDTMKQGLAGVAIGIGIMTVALMMLSGNSAAILAAGGAMVLMATAMDILVVSITALGLLPWDVVQQGLTAVGIGLALMTLSLLVLSGNAGGVVLAATAMVMITGAMLGLAVAVALFGNMDMETLAKGFGAVALGLGILLLAAAGAMYVAPGLLVLGVTIKLLGAAMLLAGLGMLAFGTGFALFAAAGVAGVAVLMIAFEAFMALLPTLALQLAAAFVTFLQAIALASPKIRKAMGTIIENMLGTIEDAIPEIGDLFQTLIDTGIGIIEKSIPQWVEMGFTIIDEFLKSAEAHVPSIVDSAIKLVSNFIGELGRRAGELAQAGVDLIVDVIEGIESAVENSDRVRDAAASLARTFVDELRETLASLIPNIQLPDIPMPDLPDIPEWAKGKLGLSGRSTVSSMRGKDKNAPPKVDPWVAAIETAGLKVANAIEGSVRLLTGATSGRAYDLGKQTSALQRTATIQSTRAGIQGVSATRAEEAASEKLADAEAKKSKTKEQKAKRKEAIAKAKTQVKAAGQQRKSADRMALAAEESQRKADAKAQQARDEVSYNAADWAGKGDIRSQQGQDLAAQAQAMLSSAEGKAAEANRLAKGSAKDRKQATQLRKQAESEARAAGVLAEQARTAQQQATAAYAEARKVAALDIIARMGDIRQQQQTEAAARQWEKDFAGATSEGKISMLDARAAQNEQKAEAARVAMEAAFAQGDALNAAIARGEGVSEAQLTAASAAADEAERQARLTSQYADQAQADRDQLLQLQQQMAQEAAQGGPAATTSGAVILPSRTALEDAALAVDRYTSSVIQAEGMAAAAAGQVQFVQNNYSPEALSASEIYRQSRNLVSVAEVKMGATT